MNEPGVCQWQLRDVDQDTLSGQIVRFISIVTSRGTE